MSRQASYRYSPATRLAAEAARQVAAAARRAEAERRAAEWAKRTSEITHQYLARYQTILDDLREQGLDEFVSAEFAEISALVSQARALTHNNPAAARDISRQIGPRIGPLPRSARQLRASSRASQAEAGVRAASADRWEEGTCPQGRAAPVDSTQLPRTSAGPLVNPVEVAWQEAISGWTDFLARDLAHVELTSLRSLIGVSGGLTEPAEVKSKVDELRVKWEAEAVKQRQEEADLLVMQQQLAEEALTQPEDLPVAGDESDPAIGADPEEARREAVRAVMNALEDAGFLVANPRLVKDSSGGDEVVVVGTRPSGASATFNLTLDRRLQYDFSGYKGSNCEADIDVVVPALQEVYGIQLTDEVVAWRNPDDLDATARPQPGRTKNA